MNEIQTPEPIITTNMSQNVNMQPASSAKGLIIKIIALVVVLGVAVFAYRTFANPFMGYTSQQIIVKALQKTSDERTLPVPSDVENTEIAFNADMVFESTDPEMPMSLNLSLPMKIFLETPEDSANMSFILQGVDFTDILQKLGLEPTGAQKLSMETRAFEDTKKAYLIVSEVPSILAAFAGNIAPMLNKWFEIDLTSYDTVNEATIATDVTKEQTKKIIESAMHHLNDTAQPEITSENISGGRKISYKVDIDKMDAAFRGFFEDANTIVGESVVDLTTMENIGDESDGTLEFTFVVDKRFNVTHIEMILDTVNTTDNVPAKTVVSIVLDDQNVTTAHLETFIDNESTITVDVKTTAEVDGGVLKNSSMTLDSVIMQDFRFGLDANATYTPYTGTRITVPEGAEPFPLF